MSSYKEFVKVTVKIGELFFEPEYRLREYVIGCEFPKEYLELRTYLDKRDTCYELRIYKNGDVKGVKYTTYENYYGFKMPRVDIEFYDPEKKDEIEKLVKENLHLFF